MPDAPNRWLILGQLVLRSPLGVRSGETEPKRFEGEQVDVQCAKLDLDVRGRPCIPGTSLKGALRAWLAQKLGAAHRGSVGNPSRLEQVFGHEPRQVAAGAEPKGGRGGKAEFHDAFLVGDGSAEPTIIVSRAAIGRRTATASRRLLAHAHAVPAGRRFAVAITGDGMGEDEVMLVLAALEGFNADLAGGEPIVLGSGTGSGQGLVTWEPESVQCMDAAAIARWFAEPEVQSWRTWLENRPRKDPTRLDLDAWRKRAVALFAEVAGRPAVTLRLHLDFSTPFAVGDPSRRRNEAAAPDLEPRLDELGRPLLPGTSVKGALRAQAERIWRTVHGSLPDSRDNRDGRPGNPIEWLFGVTGWQGRLAVSDFRVPHGPDAEGRGELREQEHVAIDRLAGGVSGEKKFKTRIAEAPLLEGGLALRLRGGEDDTGYLAPAIGVLALVLRDLVEGDLAFGHGTRKGMGACTARIIDLRSQAAETSAPLRELLALRGDGLGAGQALTLPAATEDAAGLAGPILEHCLAAFRGWRAPDA